jgi:hypothetical protein
MTHLLKQSRDSRSRHARALARSRELLSVPSRSDRAVADPLGSRLLQRQSAFSSQVSRSVCRRTVDGGWPSAAVDPAGTAAPNTAFARALFDRLETIKQDIRRRRPTKAASCLLIVDFQGAESLSKPKRSSAVKAGQWRRIVGVDLPLHLWCFAAFASS